MTTERIAEATLAVVLVLFAIGLLLFLVGIALPTILVRSIELWGEVVRAWGI